MEDSLTYLDTTPESRKERNRDLLQRYQAGEKDLANTIILENEGLVKHVLSKNRWLYGDNQNGIMAKDDFHQEGILGLYASLERYNPEMGEFSSYAYKVIKQSMFRHYQDKGQVIRKPEYRHQKYYKLRKIEDEYIQLYGRSPKLNTLSYLSDYSEDDILELRRDFQSVTSLDTPLLEDEGSGSMLNVIPDETDFLEGVEKKMTLIALREDLQIFMDDHLDKEDQSILKRYFYWDRYEKNIDEKICKKYSLTKRQLDNRVFKALTTLYRNRSYLAHEYLELLGTRLRVTSSENLNRFTRTINGNIAAEVLYPGQIVSLIKGKSHQMVTFIAYEGRYFKYIQLRSRYDDLEAVEETLNIYDIKDFRTENGRIVEIFI